MILEPAVALSDFALSLECGWFAAWLLRRPHARHLLALGFSALFGSVGAAALLGGITHGFLPDASSPLHRLAWTGTLLTIGLAASASWIVGAQLCLAAPLARAVAILAAALFAVYALVVVFASQSFLVAIANYLPAAAFLLFAFAYAYRRQRSQALAVGMIGVALTFLAALVQQSGYGLHPVYFDHNAAYHVVQGLALLLIFLAARGILSRSPG